MMLIAITPKYLAAVFLVIDGDFQTVLIPVKKIIDISNWDKFPCFPMLVNPTIRVHIDNMAEAIRK